MMFRRWLLFTVATVAGSFALVGSGAAQAPNRPNNGATVQGAIIVTSPHPSWFLENGDGDELVFRKFSYEGIARNIIVLSCHRDRSRPVLIELIPPKSLEAVLRVRGPEQERGVSIIVDESSFGSGKRTGGVLRYQGSYDKIAAFIRLPLDRQLETFLEFVSRSSVRITLDESNIQYLMNENEPYKKLLREGFPQIFDGSRFAEMSWQDMVARCRKLRASPA